MKKITQNEWYVEIYSWMIRIFIVLTFFFPMYQSNFKRHMYYIGFLLPYAFLVPGMGMMFLRHVTDAWKHKIFAIVQIVLVVLYAGISFYMNKRYHHWMWEEIHNTVAFAFMILLFIYPQWKEDLNFDFIRFLLHCITLSMFCAIVYYNLGYAGLRFYNGKIEMTRVEDMVTHYRETRMSWIYYHKSQFALMQLVFLGFAYRYRDRFRTIIHYGVSQLIFMICLVLAHSWTALGAAVVLVGGILLDKLVQLIKEKQVRFHWWQPVGACLLLLAAAKAGLYMLGKLGAERDLTTLGSRFPIWKAGIQFIWENPHGVGREFGKNLLNLGYTTTNNCHNVFLNAMMRFSIPVGILFTVIFAVFFLYLICRQKRFFGVGYIAALLMVLCIDYSLLSYGVASFLMLVYFAMEPWTQPQPGEAKEAGA